MKRIADYTEIWELESTVMRRVLEAWKPDSFTVSEKEQEQHLYACLRKSLPGVQMVAQYGIAKGKADIVLEDCHVIELKLGFDAENVAEFDRCIGQLERYKQKWVKKDRGPVYLVVVGESDIEFRHLLHTWFKEAPDGFYLIEKHPA